MRQRSPGESAAVVAGFAMPTDLDMTAAPVPTIDSLAGYLAGSAGGVHAEGGDRPAEPVAVIGIGCRFPGAHGPHAFWELLSRGGDAISRVPADRWAADSAAKFGGFVDMIDQF